MLLGTCLNLTARATGSHARLPKSHIDIIRAEVLGGVMLANCRISLVLISRLFFMAGSTHYEVSIWGMDAIPGNPSRAVIAGSSAPD